MGTEGFSLRAIAHKCSKVFRHLLMAQVFLFSLSAPLAHAQESVCARVKIEVAQELTLERQAFDAHMRINNGLDLIGLENVRVDVTFLDRDGKTVRSSSDPEDDSALFFIRLDTIDNIDRVDGLGSVPPRTSADIHWLIIPAPGASMGAGEGTLYQVGATLSYTIGGEPHSMVVTPDSIVVKPLPRLVLDYFLPSRVTADDPFTPEIEPPTPFSLGVRVRNSGTGTARGLRIESAQPRIVSNEQGLLLDFAIIGSEVNGGAADNSLLVNLGDILAGSSGTARWLMTCPLSGQFVEFKAEFSHGDELGGELTSLIDSVHTHLLVSDVLVDLPGRDSVRDFLAMDGGVLRVYESESVDSMVLDQSNVSSLSFIEDNGSIASYSVACPPTEGFIFMELPDPNGGSRVLKEVLRSDGKRVKPENYRLWSERIDATTVAHTLQIFDVNSTGAYMVVLCDPGSASRPPVFEAIPDRTGVEMREMALTVAATDPDGTVPALSATPLPAMARFTDLGDGRGTFSWLPAEGQAGHYDIVFTASDGELSDTRRMGLTICAAEDSDCDGMTDSWEILHFGSLSRDGKGDLDGDGVSDFDEFWRKTDPARSNAPGIPVILSPPDKGEVAALKPDLTVTNGEDPDEEDEVTHVFELYMEPAMVNLVAGADGLSGLGGTTTWTVPEELEENARYFWRVRSTDGRNFSEWAYGSFLVNTENDAPEDFAGSSPGNGMETDSLTPVLQVVNSRDPDGDSLLYTFEVYGDETLSTIVASVSDLAEGEDGKTSWTVDVPLVNHGNYFWRATVIDEHGAEASTPLNRFRVNLGNRAPDAPGIVYPVSGSEVASSTVDLVVKNGSDPDGDALTCAFEADTAETFDSPNLVRSSPVSEGAAVTRWSLSGLTDDTLWFWRARTSDGAAQSPWVQGSFFVNQANDTPSVPTVKNPGDGSWVQSLQPALQLNPVLDPDRDALNYVFEVYSDENLTGLIVRGESDSPSWTIPIELSDNSLYFWRGKAVDEHGAESGWTQASSFFVNNNGLDDPPEMTLEEPSKDVFINSGELLVRWSDEDPDSNGAIALHFTEDLCGSEWILLTSDLQEDLDGAGDTYLWDITAVPEGCYRVRGTIADGTSSMRSTAPATVTIDRTAPHVEAHPAGGTYGSPRTVALSSDEHASIHYTTDGSEPTGASPLYTAPIEINATGVLRFMAVDRAGNRSESWTEAYTIRSGRRLHRFVFGTPRRVHSGLGFMASIRAVDRRGALVKDFDGSVRLTPSAGSVEPAVAEGFSGGIWKGAMILSGHEGPVTLKASWNGVRGSSRPILVRCDPPHAPVPARPRDGAKNVEARDVFLWHAVQGALSYSVQFAADPQFVNVLHEESGILGTICTPPESFYEGLERGRRVFWRVRAVNHCGDGKFSIPRRFVYQGDSRCALTLTFPKGGERLRAGIVQTIRWEYTGNPCATVKVSFKNDASSWNTLAEGIPIGDRVLAWRVPAGHCSRCRIRVESEQHPRSRSVSGGFEIH